MTITDRVPTTLTYFTPPADGSKPWVNINSDPTDPSKSRNYISKEFDTFIENVRGKEGDYTLDKNGFQFFNIPTKIRGNDFDDEAKITDQYYEEQSDVIRALTGAGRVVIFDHTIRRHKPGDTDNSPNNRHPVSGVHVDQTPTSATARVRRHLLPAELAEETLRNGVRFQIINLWRAIRHEALDWPLALCDWQSVDAGSLVPGAKKEGGDLVPTTLKYPTHDGETFSVKWNERHEWKYLRGMAPEEGVLIKCYDSVDDGSVARLTPHTAFEDPTTPADAKLRESIELRALVFYS